MELEGMTPLEDLVIVKVLDNDQYSKGGIFLPHNARAKPQRGRVVAVGKGRQTAEGERIPLSVSVGDEVIFSKYAGADFNEKEEMYLIVSELDLLAKVNYAS